LAPHADRVISLVAGFLGPRERLLGTARLARGSSLVDIHVQSLDGRSPMATNFPWVSRATIAITTSRIIVIERSPLTGRPRSIVGAIPVGIVEAVHSVDAKAPFNMFSLGFADGSSIKLAVHPEDQVYELVGAFTEAKRSWIAEVGQGDSGQGSTDQGATGQSGSGGDVLAS
jgi:hypothetical protein